MKLTEADLICPSCKSENNFMETASRCTWQPFNLLVDDDGDLDYGEWDTWNVGDDTGDDAKIECHTCLREWADLDELKKDLLAAKAAREDGEKLNFPDNVPNHMRAKVALAVLVCDPHIRAFLEAEDPMALAQARTALGLEDKVTA